MRHPQVNLRLTPALVKRIRTAAEKNHRTLTGEIETLLELALEYRENERLRRRAALIRMELDEARKANRIPVRPDHPA